MSRCREAVAGLLGVALLFVATIARAESLTAGDSSPSRSVLIGVAPLSPLVGRWGGSVEWLMHPHHALSASLAYVDAETSVDGTVHPAGCGDGGCVPTPRVEDRIRGLATELGYRWYSSSRSLEGLFLAPSVLLFRGSGGAHDHRVAEVTNVGVAFDVGAQLMLFDRLALSAGLGLEATHALPAPWQATTDWGWLERIFVTGDRMVFSHVAPRLLLGVGVAL